MNGLELSRSYYEECLLPELKRAAGELVSQMAFGLVGPGSECYGFDDEISRDHDWGPRVCIWVPQEVFHSDGERLQNLYDALPQVHRGYGPVNRLDTRVRRDGVFTVHGFYETFLGTSVPPDTIRQWLLLNEEALSVSTNGEVFQDNHGDFSRVRSALKAYFPHDIRLKMIASRLKSAGQHGQYNLARAFQRSDMLAALHHAASFVEEIARLAYLLAGRYRPHAKWLYRGLLELGESGGRVHEALSGVSQAVAGNNSRATASRLAESVAACSEAITAELERQHLCPGRRQPLYDLAARVEEQIASPLLRDGIDIID